MGEKSKESLKCDTKITAWKMILLSFMIPGILVTLAFLALQICPFGEKTLVLSDANGYYMPYLSYCKTIFEGNHDIFYSFSQDIGGGIAATIWPYLLNPFSWIFCFFSYDLYLVAFSIGVIIANCLYGLNMYLLLADIHGHKIENLLISTSYALSGFAVCFNINTPFFLGGPLCLPLMVLGLRKIFRNESPILYIFSITYSTVLQMQMGFAVCMAAFLFFLFKLYVEDHGGKEKRLWVRFAGNSLCGGLLGAFIWLPGLLIIRQGRGNLSINDFVFEANAPLLQYAARLFTGANSVKQIVDGFPSIFCGILPIALTILYFRNKRICKKRKKAYAIFLLVYILGFYICTFTSIFQGLTHANWFNFRFSFVFICLILLISAEQLNALKEINKSELIDSGKILLIFAILVFFVSYEFIDGAMLVVDFLLLTVMGYAILFHKKSPERAPYNLVIIVLCFCTFFQLYLNYYLCSQHVFNDWKDYDIKYKDSLLKKEPLINGIKQLDEGFYRIESEQELDASIGNDSFLLDYNGVGFAGHTERGFVSKGLSRLGIDHVSSCWNSYDEGIPAATDTLLGIKYMISERDLCEEKEYEKKGEPYFDLTVYENPYCLKIGFLSDTGIQSVSIIDEKNIFKNLNELWSRLVGDSRTIFVEEKDIEYSNHNPCDLHTIKHKDVLELMQEETIIESNNENNTSSESPDMTLIPQRETVSEYNQYSPYIEYVFVAKQTGPIYLYDSSAYIEDSGASEDIVQYVGYYTKGDKVLGRLYLGYEISEQLMIDTIKGLHICYEDIDLLQEYCSIINSENCRVIKVNDSKLRGDFYADDGQRLVFTIPYDEGWILTVDGNEVDIEKTADLFMSAPVENGKHHFEMTFRPVGLKIGILVSSLATLLLVVLCIVNGASKSRT